LVIDRKWIAVTVVNGGGQNMRFRREGSQDILRGTGIFKGKRRRAVRSNDIREGIQILKAQFLETIHSVFR
jgi:hypothetical protein